MPSRPVAAVDPELLAAVERFAFAALGVTERALAATSGMAELSLPQWRVLTLLDRASGPLRLADLASVAGLSASSASRMVSRLAGRGYIVTAIDLQDRRAIRIRLTRSGTQVVSRVIEARRRELSASLATVRVPSTAATAIDVIVTAIERGSGPSPAGELATAGAPIEAGAASRRVEREA